MGSVELPLDLISFCIRHGLYYSIAETFQGRNIDVLDIGCGDGTGPASLGPILLASTAGRYLGMDILPYKNVPFPFIQGDFVEGPVLENTFDAVVAFYLIQYVNQDKLFRRVKRVLRPHGLAFFSEGLGWRKGHKLSYDKLISIARKSVGKTFKNSVVRGIIDGCVVPVEYGRDGVFIVAEPN